MRRTCPICNLDVDVPAGARHCPECEGMLDSYDTDELETIPPNRPGRISKQPQPRLLEQEPDSDPAPPRPKRRRSRSPAPEADRKPKPPAPSPLPKWRRVEPPYQPPRPEPPQAPPPPAPGPPPIMPQGRAETWRVKLGKWLLGESASAPPNHEARAEYRRPLQDLPSEQIACDRPRPVGQAHSVERPAPPPPNAPERKEPLPNFALPRDPPRPEPVPIPVDAFAPEHGGDDDETKTVGWEGINLKAFSLPNQVYMLQLYTGKDSWENWGEIPAGGRNVGRGKVTAKDHPLWTMARKHLRLSFSQSALCVEDLGSLNGVFRRITRPEEIADGTRFRIGRHVLEFHMAGPVEPVQPQRSDDQEEFVCRDLGSLAFLHVLRPDGSCGLIFPLTKETTVIGRETRGDPARDLAAIALSGDKSTSKIHARIVRHDDRFYLEDLGSTDGTYIQIVGRQNLAEGAELRAGRVRLRVIAVSYNQRS